MLGTLFIISACLILIAVLYGHQKRETFTNIRGPFPKWTDVLQQVRKILDAQFEYDAMKFAEFVDRQRQFSSISTEVINTFSDTKYLPKSFELNVDAPFDAHMAMLYAKRSRSVEEMKKPTDVGKLMLAYTQYYDSISFGIYLKNETISRIIKACYEEKIITSLKEKSTFSIL